MRILALALVALAPLAGAAPRADYVASLGRVYTAINEVGHTHDICRGLYPQLAPANTHALAQWRQRHKPLLDEYQARYLAYVRALAGRDERQYRTYLKIMDGKFQQRRTVRAAEIRLMPAAKSRSLCQNYPALIESSLHPERVALRDIQLTRRVQPLAPVTPSPARNTYVNAR